MKAVSAFLLGGASLGLATPPHEYHRGPPDGRGPPPWVDKIQVVTLVHTSTIWTTGLGCPGTKPHCPYSQMTQTSECITKTSFEVVSSTVLETAAAPTTAVQQVSSVGRPLPAPSSVLGSASGSAASSLQTLVDGFGNTRPPLPIIPTFPTTSTGPHAPPSRTDSLPGAAPIITNEAISDGVPSQPVITNEAIDTDNPSGMNAAPAPTGIAGSQSAAGAAGSAVAGASGSAAPGVPQPVPAPTAGTQAPVVSGVAPSSGSAASGASQNAATDVAVPPGQSAGGFGVPASGVPAPASAASGSAGAPAGQATVIPGAPASLSSASVITRPDGSVSTVLPAGHNTDIPVGQSTTVPGVPASSASASVVTGANGSVSTVVPAVQTTGAPGSAASSGSTSVVTGANGSVSTVVSAIETTGVPDLAAFSGSTSVVTDSNGSVSTVIPAVQTSGVSVGQTSGAVSTYASSGAVASGSASAASGVPTVAVLSGSTVIGGVTLPIPASASAASGVPTVAVPSGSTGINGVTVPVSSASNVVPSSGLSASVSSSASAASDSASASVAFGSDSALSGVPTVSVPSGSTVINGVTVPVVSDVPAPSVLSGSAGSASGASSASADASASSSGLTSGSSSVPASTGAVATTSWAPQTSAPTGSSTVPASITSAPTIISSSTTGSIISPSSSGNASVIVWDTLFLSNNFWQQGGQQTIGCPEGAPGCCVKLPASQLTSTQILSYAPLQTFVWVLEGEGDYKTAGSWDLPDEAGGEITVCSYERGAKATQKSTVLDIPAKTVTKVNFGEICNEKQNEIGSRFLNPCNFATILPPRITATLGPREIWQQPLGMRGGAPGADPAHVTFAACESGTKWVVQPQPTQGFECNMSPVTVVNEDQGNNCDEGSVGCFGGPPDTEAPEGEDDDDEDSDLDVGTLFGFCKPKGLFANFIPALASLECFCGIFGCDGGCGILGCSRGPCGVVSQIPLVGGPIGGLLGAFGLCEPKCQFPCGFGGGVRWPPAPRPPGQPKPTTPPTTNPTQPPTTRPTGQNTSDKTDSESESTSSSSCSETTATVTNVSCFTGTATTSCQSTAVVTRGCSVTPTATTKFCSASTATHRTVFCASSGTSGTCLSTSTVASTVITACDVTATETTTYAPACPAQMTLTPDDEFSESGGYENEVPRVWGPPDPICEIAATADRTVPMDAILKPQIEDFCSKPSTPYMIPGISDAGGSSDGGGYLYWEHHCTFGEDEKSVLGIAVASEPKCQETKFSKEDCQKQLTAIADACVKDANNKNEKIAGDVWDQKCFGYGIAVYTHEAGEKPPKCISGPIIPPATEHHVEPANDKNSARAYKFQLSLQWASKDYDSNAKDRMVWGFYGARADTDMWHCHFMWAVAGNLDADKPGYGEGDKYLKLATDEGSLHGTVKEFVDNAQTWIYAMPAELQRTWDDNPRLLGGGTWPVDRYLNLGGACNRECRLTRYKDKVDELYVTCIALTAECLEIKEKQYEKVANEYKIDYRCSKIQEPLFVNCGNGGQAGSIVDCNNFVAMWTCEYKYDGSGVKRLETQVAASLAAKSTSAAAAASRSSAAAKTTQPTQPTQPPPAPKPAEAPVPHPNSYKDVEWAVVYSWTKANYEADFGSGSLQLYAFRQRDDKLGCDLYNQRPDGPTYGFFEQPLDEFSLWNDNWGLQTYVSTVNSGRDPAPVPERFPESDAETMGWPGNDCITKCWFETVHAGDGHIFEDHNDVSWWVTCRDPHMDCVEKVTGDDWQFRYECKEVQDAKRVCTMEGNEVSYSQFMICHPRG